MRLVKAFSYSWHSPRDSIRLHSGKSDLYPVKGLHYLESAANMFKRIEFIRFDACRGI